MNSVRDAIFGYMVDALLMEVEGGCSDEVVGREGRSRKVDVTAAHCGSIL